MRIASYGLITLQLTFCNRTIVSTIEIYKKWSLNPPKQPICWVLGTLMNQTSLQLSLTECFSEEQYFIQRVFLHSSAIFNVRPHTDSQKHVDLCHCVLQLWLNIGRTLEKRLSIETWAVILKVRTRRKKSSCL